MISWEVSRWIWAVKNNATLRSQGQICMYMCRKTASDNFGYILKLIWLTLGIEFELQNLEGKNLYTTTSHAAKLGQTYKKLDFIPQIWGSLTLPWKSSRHRRLNLNLDPRAATLCVTMRGGHPPSVIGRYQSLLSEYSYYYSFKSLERSSRRPAHPPSL